MKDRGKTARAFAWMGLERGISFAVSFGGGIVLARLLDPSDFGVVAMATALYMVLARLSGIGIDAQVIRLDGDDEKTRRWLSTYVWVNTAIIGIVWLIAIAVAWALPVLDARGFRVFLVVACGWSCYALFGPWRARLQKELRYGELAVLALTASILGTGGAVAMAATGFGLWSLVVPRSVVLIACGSVAILLAGRIPLGHFESRAAHHLLSRGWVFLGVSFCEEAYRRVDDLVVGSMLGDRQLGFYQRAFNLGGMLHHNAASVVAHVMLPYFAKHREDRDALVSTYRSLARLLIYGTAFSVVMLLLYIDVLIGFIYGEKWLPTAPIFRAFAPYAVILPLFELTKHLLIALGHVQLARRAYVWMLVVLIALLYPGVVLGQGAGAALAVAAAALAGLVLMLWHVRRLLSVNPLRIFVLPSVSMLCCGAALFACRRQVAVVLGPWPTFACVAGLAVALAAVQLFIVDPGPLRYTVLTGQAAERDARNGNQ